MIRTKILTHVEIVTGIETVVVIDQHHPQVGAGAVAKLVHQFAHPLETGALLARQRRLVAVKELVEVGGHLFTAWCRKRVVGEGGGEQRVEIVEFEEEEGKEAVGEVPRRRQEEGKHSRHLQVEEVILNKLYI